ncbi:hypothetical protein F383_09442 [Gossypium arboreum]|uniref:Uncharacterized protein n=1 Tax=Gossypium arboreum TaxID=29729 RepID=A0A0B0PQZ6_GOSAR|nr:hypothetical protein F383_09442 [Gossypium arboreum]
MLVLQAVWKQGIHTDLGHTANHTLVCLARVPFKMATHARVPFKAIC